MIFRVPVEFSNSEKAKKIYMTMPKRKSYVGNRVLSCCCKDNTSNIFVDKSVETPKYITVIEEVKVLTKKSSNRNESCRSDKKRSFYCKSTQNVREMLLEKRPNTVRLNKPHSSFEQILQISQKNNLSVGHQQLQNENQFFIKSNNNNTTKKKTTYENYGTNYKVMFSYITENENIESSTSQIVDNQTFFDPIKSDQFHKKCDCISKNISSIKIKKYKDDHVNNSNCSSLTEESAIDSNDYMDFSISFRSLFSI